MNVVRIQVKYFNEITRTKLVKIIIENTYVHRKNFHCNTHVFWIFETKIESILSNISFKYFKIFRLLFVHQLNSKWTAIFTNLKVHHPLGDIIHLTVFTNYWGNWHLIDFNGTVSAILVPLALITNCFHLTNHSILTNFNWQSETK